MRHRGIGGIERSGPVETPDINISFQLSMKIVLTSGVERQAQVAGVVDHQIAKCATYSYPVAPNSGSMSCSARATTLLRLFRSPGSGRLRAKSHSVSENCHRSICGLRKCVSSPTVVDEERRKASQGKRSFMLRRKHLFSS